MVNFIKAKMIKESYMPNYGILENTLITNVIVAETKEIAEQVTGKTCVELPPLNVGTGWTYEGGTFSAPDA
jgi:hypothetical protein